MVAFYNANIPQGNQTGSETQNSMLQNFTAIERFMAVDHATFGEADQGKHDQLTMPTQQAAPTTLAGEIALFSLLSGGLPELSWKQESNGSTIEFTSRQENGWTRLPSGILMKWFNNILLQGDPITGIDVVELEDPLRGPKFLSVYTVFVTPTNPTVYNFTSYVKTWDTTSVTVFSTLRYDGNTGVNMKANLLVLGI